MIEPGVVDAPSGDAAPSTQAGSRTRVVIRFVLVVVGWSVVAVLGLLALLRWLAWDSIEPLIVLNALTLLVYLPAWIVAAGACIGRRWWLAGAAGLVVVCQIVFVAPEFLAATPAPTWTAHARSITVLDANIDKSVTFETGYQDAIRRYHPDVMAFEEFTPPAYQSMLDSGILRGYRYHCAAPSYGATGFLLASKWRLTGCRVRMAQWVGSEVAPYMVEATMWLSGRPIAVRVVHTLAPLPVSWHEWTNALSDVNRSVRASGTAHMLMVGDFNATWGNKGFVQLLHDGLTDGAAARGHALQMTWPNGAVVPPFVRIDHVLTGAHLAVTSIAANPGFGSDHRYLLARVAVQS